MKYVKFKKPSKSLQQIHLRKGLLLRWIFCIIYIIILKEMSESFIISDRKLSLSFHILLNSKINKIQQKKKTFERKATKFKYLSINSGDFIFFISSFRHLQEPGYVLCSPVNRSVQERIKKGVHSGKTTNRYRKKVHKAFQLYNIKA